MKRFAIAAIAAVCGCGARAPHTEVPRASPEALSVAFAGPSCEPDAAPHVEDVIASAVPDAGQRVHWRVTGCFPAQLRSDACDWACTAEVGSPCGNDARRTMLLLVVEDRVVAQAAVRAHGDDLFRRDFRVDVDATGPALTVLLVNGSAPVLEDEGADVETYRWIDGELRLVTTSSSGSAPRRGDLVAPP